MSPHSGTTCVGSRRFRDKRLLRVQSSISRLRNKPLNWLGGGETRGYRASSFLASARRPRAPAASARVDGARGCRVGCGCGARSAGRPRSARARPTPGNPLYQARTRPLARGGGASAPRHVAGRSGRGAGRRRPGAARQRRRCRSARGSAAMRRRTGSGALSGGVRARGSFGAAAFCARTGWYSRSLCRRNLALPHTDALPPARRPGPFCAARVDAGGDHRNPH